MRIALWLVLMGCAGGSDTDVDSDTDGFVDADGDGADASIDCDDADPERFPGNTERCDDVDRDCSGDPRDGAALGSTEECAADSCIAVRDRGAAAPSGRYWLNLQPVGVDENGELVTEDATVQAWCDNDLAGGGWMMLWTTAGGRLGVGNEHSTFDLLNLPAADIDSDEPEPHTVTLGPAIDREATAHVAFTPDIQLMRHSTLYDADDVAVQDDVLVFTLSGGVSIQNLYPTPEVLGEAQCSTTPGRIALEVNGEDWGSTTTVTFNASSSRVYGSGLANARADFDLSCGLDDADLIGAGLTSEQLAGLDSPNHVWADNRARVGGVFGYNMYARGEGNAFNSGASATRCFYSCWPDDFDGGYGDGVTFYAR